VEVCFIIILHNVRFATFSIKFLTASRSGSVLLILILCIFSDPLTFRTDGFFSAPMFELASVCNDFETQMMVFLSLMIYFTIFLFLRSRPVLGFWQMANPLPWVVCVLVISAGIYIVDYVSSTQALTLLVCAVLGQGAAVWTTFENKKSNAKSQNAFVLLVVLLIVLMLAFASIWSVHAEHSFVYHGNARWTGPWNNPNVYGMLMGAGTVIALGLLVQGFRLSIHCKSRCDGAKIKEELEIPHVTSYARWLLRLFVVLCFIAAILMGHGLLRSYSRGAWVGTVCGLTYLFWKRNTYLTSTLSPRSTDGEGELCSYLSSFRKNLVPLSIVVMSVLVLSFWYLRQADWYLPHRAFSAGNQNDFSWRNRVAAWEGALQITAEHPLFGAGWNQPAPLYEQYYLPAKLSEGAAIEMNDYLMLGATLGVPALFCFGMYVWLSLTEGVQNPKFKVQTHSNAECGVRSAELEDKFKVQGLKFKVGDQGNTEGKEDCGGSPQSTDEVACATREPNADWPKAVCRAGAIVLLIGFWFDGGVFKLATASVFWILLELGRGDLTTDAHG
jgi:O-antigen ligase